MRAMMMAAALAAALCLTTTAAAQAQSEAPLLHTMFSEHAVLQRDQPIRIYGRAAPGETVTIALQRPPLVRDGSAGGAAIGEASQRASAEGTADAQGRWLATLPATPAGGPYTLTARAGSRTQSVNDVMVGDVFFCSGQSNMEMGVRGTLLANFEIANSANPNIRMLTVPQIADPVIHETFGRATAWQVAGPETLGTWSATCYYFARELRKTVNVPMGLITAAWGGSNIRAWVSEEAARAVGGYEANLNMLRDYRTDPAAAQRAFGAQWGHWWREKSGDRAGAEPWQIRTSVRDWRRAPEGLGNYRQWDDPAVKDFTGILWYRTSVRLTAAQARQAAALELGSIDEVDQTWVNGAPIGNTFGYGTPRTYQLAAGSLRAGENVIVVNVTNTWANGGLVGDHALRMIRFADGTTAPLNGEWRYKPAPRDYGYPPRAPWEAVGGLSTMHNGMVAPIGPYNVRAGLWYQGESNADAPGDYQQLMTALIGDWRRTFRAPELPVLVVQLPNFGAQRQTAPGQSGWASVREAQRRAVEADAHAGLAVTIDAGDAFDLHPANKQEIGRRLARAGRHVIYGEAVAPSGPRIVSARRQGGEIVLEFADVDRELVALSGAGPNGFELCAADQASCRFVAATQSGSRVALAGAGVPNATRVRYCWADSPVCTLYDRSGAPAGPFEQPIQ